MQTEVRNSRGSAVEKTCGSSQVELKSRLRLAQCVLNVIIGHTSWQLWLRVCQCICICQILLSTPKKNQFLLFVKPFSACALFVLLLFCSFSANGCSFFLLFLLPLLRLLCMQKKPDVPLIVYNNKSESGQSYYYYRIRGEILRAKGILIVGPVINANELCSSLLSLSVSLSWLENKRILTAARKMPSIAKHKRTANKSDKV